MRPIMTNAERQRNARLQELHKRRTNTLQQQLTPTRPTRLSSEQMDRVNELREQGMTREDSVDKVLNDKEDRPERRFIRNKEIVVNMQIEQYYESQRVNDIYRTEYLRQRQR